MTRRRPFAPNLRVMRFTAALLALGAVGGEVAVLLGLPLPWMIGSLTTAALVVALAPGRIPAGYVFPMELRMGFIAVIGVMIGAQVDGDTLAGWRGMLISLGGITLFVMAAHAINYALFRRIGGYDRATAFFCGTPGGVIESVTLGEPAGADVRIVALQQFLRIILVVTLVPIGLSLLHGQALGSAAGLGFARDTARLSAVPLLIVVALVGLVLGRWLRLPAGQLTGPLAIAATLGATGVLQIDAPGWILGVAQVVIGTALGVRFIGVTIRMLRRGLWLSVLSVGAMMGLGVALALGVHAITGQSTEVLVLSFAPGGLTEMGLVALSLAANPAVVAFHHLYRITLTVVQMSLLARWLGMSGR